MAPVFCPSCQTPLTGELDGLCRRCLLQTTLKLEDGDSTSTAGGLFGAIDTDLNILNHWSGLVDYELLDEIARGGMGTVFRARQRSLNRVVALKIISAGPLARAEELTRFRNEAEATARLQHPNIVAIFEVGENDEQPWFAMEYVEGPSLATAVRSGPFAPDRAASILRVVADAIQHAHDRGILHRDLKPSNILLAAGDIPRVTDFGLAKFLQRDSSVTRTDGILGSPNYMSPEQASGRNLEVDPRSEVYALGAVLYELLTGRPPFQASSPVQTLNLVVETEPVLPTRLNPNIPRDLETICVKCLSKNPSQRYQTARALADELTAFLERRPIRARPTSAGRRAWQWGQRKPALTAALGALLLTLVGGILGIAWQWRRAEARGIEARRQLYGQLVARAHSQSRVSEPGARAASLAAIRQAVSLRGSNSDLRSEAITALALPELQEMKRWHSAAASLHCFSENLQHIARIAADGAIEVIRTEDDVIVSRLPPMKSPPSHIGPFSPDETRLVVLSAQGATVLDLATGKPLLTLDDQMGGWPIVFSANGNTICKISENGKVTVGSVSSHEIKQFSAFMPTGTGLAINPEGTVAALIQTDEVRRWGTNLWLLDLRTGAMTNRALPAIPYGLTWSPAGDKIAVSTTDFRIRVFNINDSDAATLILPGHGAYAYSLAFSSDGDLLASGGVNGSSILWDTHDGQELGRLDQWGERFSFSRDAHRFGVCERDSGDLVMYAFRVSQACRILTDRAVQNGEDSRVAFGPDGLLVLPRSDGGRIFRLADGRLLGRLPGPGASVAQFDFSKRAIFLVDADRIQRRSLELTDEGWIIEQAEEKALVNNGSVLPLRDESFFYYDWNAPAFIASWTGSRLALPEGSSINIGATSPDGNWLAGYVGIGEEPRALVWDLQGRLVSRLPFRTARSLALAPNGEVLFLISEQQLLSVHARKGTTNWLSTEQTFSGEHPSLAVSADGRLLAAQLGASRIGLFDASNGTFITRVEHPFPRPIQSFLFSNDNSWLAVACADGTAQLWNLREVRNDLQGLGLDWNHPTILPSEPPPFRQVSIKCFEDKRR